MSLSRRCEAAPHPGGGGVEKIRLPRREELTYPNGRAALDCRFRWRRGRSGFPKFFPEHKDKELRGLVAAVDLPQQLAQRVLRVGLYLARIRDDTFVLDVPDDFEPRSFNG